MKKDGKLLTPEERTADIMATFTPEEGFNFVYYGKIRNGKSYTAVMDMIELLDRGEVVVSNIDINWEEYDQRDSLGIMILKLLTGKKHFYRFRDNFYYMDSRDPDFVKNVKEMVGVHLFIDEGQWIFNSHSRNDDIDSRMLVLEGGHYCRSLNVITQRPSNILKDIRSQVNVWYKIEKRINFGRLIMFTRWEMQEMINDLPDEENPEPRPKNYWGRAKYFNMYNTHGRRGENAIEIPTNFDVFELTQWQKLKMIVKHLTPFKKPLVSVSEQPMRSEGQGSEPEASVQTKPSRVG